MVFKAKGRPHKYKKAKYAIVNVIKKDPWKIIKKFDKLPYETYEKKSPKHEPTDSYFYLARQLVKCMMRSDAFNSHVYPVRTEITALYSHVCCTDKDESKRIIMHETLSQNCYMDEGESKRSIINKNLPQKSSADEAELSFTEEEKS